MKLTPLAMRLSLALALGCLSIAGFAPYGVLPAPTLALAGLFLLWRHAPSARHAALLGLSWGLGCFGLGASWIYVSLSQFSGLAPALSVVATFLFCLYLALFPALAGAFFARWREPYAALNWRDALLFAGLWTLSEWLRGNLLTGFPWLSIGYSQTPPSPLAGYATVFGVYGVGTSVALISALLAVGWRSVRHVILALVIIGIGAVLARMEWTTPYGKPLVVNLLQGNVPQDIKWSPQQIAYSVESYIALTAQSAQQRPATLTVLPETALPLFLNEVPQHVLRALTLHGDALVGVPATTSTGGYANAAVAISPTLTMQAYAKRHLVPFGEYAPPGFNWFFKWLRIPMSDFTAGPDSPPPMTIADQRISPNICYEDLFGEELLYALPQATLLLNMSNTAWFGDSLAQPQHLQIAQMRAMETGRVMLRATNTGMTAMVLPNGIVAAQLPPFSRGVLHVEAQGYSGLTPYAKWGNALILILALGATLPTLWQRRQRQREASSR